RPREDHHGARQHRARGPAAPRAVAVERRLGMASLSALSKIRPEVVIRRLPGRDENYVIVKDPAERQYYKFEEWEHDLLLRMDGTSTLEDLAAEYNRLRPGSEADASSMADYVEELRGMGLLERTEQERHLVWLDKLRRSKRGRFVDAKRSS